ncbi:MAG: polyprenyl synthetase family protein, partial [Planctomycetota bacterium]
AEVVRGASREDPPPRDQLESWGRSILHEADGDPSYLQFAMVAAHNAFWSDQFRAAPASERLLLLPHCLRDEEECRGDYDAAGLTCRRCGSCVLDDLQSEAEQRGYSVLIAEGTPAVVQMVLRGEARAVLGVACLESLREAFDTVSRLGIPLVAVPLLQDGCRNTAADLDAIRSWMDARAGSAGARTRTYVPLLRAARSLFESPTLRDRIPGVERSADADAPLNHTRSLALDWLQRGGKRFRPFVVLASYAALAGGRETFEPGAELDGVLPAAVERTAIAIEALHKASLVHDDIEDGDRYRYGQPTLHVEHGTAVALNVGDYLVGLGYRLISSVRRDVGAECMGDIIAHLSDAHLKLTQGQGAELEWQRQDAESVTSSDVQSIYALKTAPAYEAALYAGLRLGLSEGERDLPNDGSGEVPEPVRKFCRYLGAAYQLDNDLKDWHGDEENKVLPGRDALSGRPTMLQAFAMEAADEETANELTRLTEADLDDAEKLDRIREIYGRLGVVERACRLLHKYREAAQKQADDVEWPELGRLMKFIVETVL